jgi:hypothetical protein
LQSSGPIIPIVPIFFAHGFNPPHQLVNVCRGAAPESRHRVSTANMVKQTDDVTLRNGLDGFALAGSTLLRFGELRLLLVAKYSYALL